MLAGGAKAVAAAEVSCHWFHLVAKFCLRNAATSRPGCIVRTESKIELVH